VISVNSAVPEHRGSDRLRHRRNIVVAIVVLVVIAVAGAALLTTQIKSPAQQAAQTRPPALTQLTATVQRAVLTTTVLAQGVVGSPKEITASSSGGGGGGGGPSGQNVQSIVTRVFHRKGSVIGQGTVLFEVAGQPFFVLAGTVPAYRNLEPGETGQDVVQLQDDLESLGYGIGGDTSGDFGPGTAAAVNAYYQAIGYKPQQNTAGPRADRGPVIPLGEYAFVSRLPARIVKLGASVGQAPKGLTLALGNPVIKGQLSPSDDRVVRPGMPVTITEPGTGVTLPGRVTSVSHTTASSASISGGLYVHMGIKADRPLPMSMVGQDVTLAIASARSSGPVLAVPEAAVFASADGGTYVSKMAGASQVKVPVKIGISGNGLLQVIPRQPGALSAGDRVVTGANYSAGGSTTVRRAPGQRGGFGFVPGGSSR
jgi:peptidoglycan hydrolase-like protein with peptidoglycan-binding domain